MAIAPDTGIEEEMGAEAGQGLGSDWKYSQRAFNPRALAVSQRFSRRLAPRSPYVGMRTSRPQYEGENQSGAQMGVTAPYDPRRPSDFGFGPSDGGDRQDAGHQAEAAGLESPISNDFMSPGLERDMLSGIFGPAFAGAAKDTASSLAQGYTVAKDMGISARDYARMAFSEAPAMYGATLAGPGSTMGTMARGFMSLGDAAAAQRAGMGLRSEMSPEAEAARGYSEYGSPAQREAAEKGRARDAYGEHRGLSWSQRARDSLRTMNLRPDIARAQHISGVLDKAAALDPDYARDWNRAVLAGKTPQQAKEIARRNLAARMNLQTESGRAIGDDYGIMGTEQTIEGYANISEEEQQAALNEAVARSMAGRDGGEGGAEGGGGFGEGSYGGWGPGDTGEASGQHDPGDADAGWW